MWISKSLSVFSQIQCQLKADKWKLICMTPYFVWWLFPALWNRFIRFFYRLYFSVKKTTMYTWFSFRGFMMNASQIICSLRYFFVFLLFHLGNATNNDLPETPLLSRSRVFKYFAKRSRFDGVKMCEGQLCSLHSDPL